eukprot:m.42092 g.42092  ORF g.42092 m.42092 type:complete len:195 (+) comp12856_c0_seq2:100-684(+)
MNTHANDLCCVTACCCCVEGFACKECGCAVSETCLCLNTASTCRFVECTTCCKTSNMCCCFHQRCGFPCDQEVPCMLAFCGLICYDGRTPEQKASGAGMTTVVVNNTVEAKSSLIVNEQPPGVGYAPQPAPYHPQQQQQPYPQQQYAPQHQGYSQQPPPVQYMQQPTMSQPPPSNDWQPDHQSAGWAPQGGSQA